MQERKRDLYEPYLDEIRQMLEDGCVITHIHKEIAKKRKLQNLDKCKRGRTRINGAYSSRGKHQKMRGIVGNRDR